jgi:formylglycine-generating enzyme required for sulfatase activity
VLVVQSRSVIERVCPGTTMMPPRQSHESAVAAAAVVQSRRSRVDSRQVCYERTVSTSTNDRSTKSMVRVTGGAFRMGSEDFYPEERPVCQVQVDDFWIDCHPVTVGEFRRFVRATGHVTAAECAPRAEDYPDADPSLLVPGSLVFRPTPGPVPLDDYRRWWHWVPGADWRHPEGAGSNVGGRERSARRPVGGWDR